MNVRMALLEATDEFEKIFERQIRVQTTDDVKFSGAFANALLGALVNFIQRKCVRAGGVWIAAECAEFAVRDADVGRIDVPVDVVIGDAAMFFLADVIREPADGEKIGRAMELKTA